jgi:hypothetical protein
VDALRRHALEFSPQPIHRVTETTSEANANRTRRE